MRPEIRFCECPRCGAKPGAKCIIDGEYGVKVRADRCHPHRFFLWQRGLMEVQRQEEERLRERRNAEKAVLRAELRKQAKADYAAGRLAL